MQYNCLLSVCLAVMVLLASCREDDSHLAVGVSLVEFSNEGGSQTMKIESDGDWSIYDVPDWVTISHFSGINSQEVTITALPNYRKLDREHIISVRSNDGKNVYAVNILQYGYTGGRLLLVDDESEKFFDGRPAANSDDIEDSIVISSSVRWRISGPSWLHCKYNNVITKLDGNLKEGSGTIYLFNASYNKETTALYDTIRIQADYSDEEIKIPVTQLGVDEIKCVNILTLTDGFAFKIKYGFGVEYVWYGFYEGKVPDEDVVWEQLPYVNVASNSLIYFNPDICTPDADYTICMRGLPDLGSSYNKKCSEIVHTPSKQNQPYAPITNVEFKNNVWSFDITKNQFATGYYTGVIVTENVYYKPFLAYQLRYGDLKTWMGSIWDFETTSTTFDVPNQNGYIVSWAVGQDGKLSDMMDVYRISSINANSAVMEKVPETYMSTFDVNNLHLETVKTIKLHHYK